MKQREIPAEFEITEEPLDIGGDADAGDVDPWRQALQKVARLEERALDVEASLRKISEGRDSGKRKLLLDVIDVVDNIDRILAAGGGAPNPEASRWIKRFERTRRTLEESLAKEQVVPIDFEQAPDGLVTTREEVERDDVPDGTILEVDYRGYLWRGEILRKASVVRACNSARGKK